MRPGRPKKQIKITHFTLDPQKAYRNLIEWLYIYDGDFSSRSEWREVLIAKIRSELGVE